MKIITGSEILSEQEKCAIALGKFDGIHMGHQKLLSLVLEQKAKGLIPCVLTFDPPPEVLFGWSDGKELTTKEEKRRIFQEMGVEILVEFSMTRETAAMPAEEFVTEVLVRRLHCNYLAAGKDVSFGQGGKGNEALLRSLASRYHFQLETIDKVCIDGQEVSSTYIRALVKDGRMEECARYLGRPYSIQGKIIHGKAMGTSMGIPTANLPVPEDKLMPPRGVYFAQVRSLREAEAVGCGLEQTGDSSQEMQCDNREHILAHGISNIGVKPTIPGENPLGVETMLFDFQGDLYGRMLEVNLWHFHRTEQRFEDVEALKAQIQQDIVVCKQYITDYPKL